MATNDILKNYGYDLNVMNARNENLKTQQLELKLIIDNLKDIIDSFSRECHTEKIEMLIQDCRSIKWESYNYFERIAHIVVDCDISALIESIHFEKCNNVEHHILTIEYKDEVKKGWNLLIDYLIKILNKDQEK